MRQGETSASLYYGEWRDHLRRLPRHRDRAAARVRGLLSGLAQEAYGRDVGDAHIEREGIRTLHSIIAD